ncbi:XdhC family protein [Jatrophihabitans sp. YIM 134969]
MFDIAPTVLSWLSDGVDVTLARVVAASGLAGREAAGVAAWAGPGSRFGELHEGAYFGNRTGYEPVGSQLALRAQGSVGRVAVSVTDDDAQDMGLSCGGSATVLVQHATDLPQTFWSALQRGEPVGLVDTTDPAAGTWAFDAADVPERFARLFGRGVSQVSEVGDETVTTYWPRTRVLVVGGGPVAAALTKQTELLGWSTVVAEDLATATDGLRMLAGADAVIVLSHDRDVDGPLLSAAIASPVGYIGAMGSRHTQQARADWFAANGVVAGLARIHGPAGLDIGGFGPAEIALSIVAEIVAVRSGTAG